jgi:hypothetical protein
MGAVVGQAKKDLMEHESERIHEGQYQIIAPITMKFVGQ